MTNKKSDDDLIGFRDFLEHKVEKSSIEQTNTKRLNDFELVTFLDQDSKRLSKLLELYEEKTYVIKNFPQDINLISKQSVVLIEQKAQLIPLLLRPDAPVHKNLAELFNEFFNS
jgi:hypothetical protein